MFLFNAGLNNKCKWKINRFCL